MNEPVGIIGTFCPDEMPPLGIFSVMAPPLATGNRCLLVASEPFPLAATDLHQVLGTSDLPDGVVNILTLSHWDLAPAAGRTRGCRCSLKLLLNSCLRRHGKGIGGQP